MKDAYSFHLDQASFDATYQEMYRCYERILTRMELEFRAVQADTGNIGGDNSHEFHVLAQSGEDIIAYSDTGTYAANLEKAAALTPEPAPLGAETMSRVDTPNAKTIDTVAAQLGLSTSQNVKTLIVEGEEDDALIAIILRGDHELNEIKAARLPGVASPLTFAAEERIPMVMGANVGSLGPVDCNIPFYVDASAASVADFVCGANEDVCAFSWCELAKRCSTTARTDCGCPQSCRGRFRPRWQRKDPVFARHRSRTHFSAGPLI